MEKDRLAAFSDGVIAVIITIMVLDLRPPHDVTLTGLHSVLPALTAYVLSFVYVAIYWNNHHHFYHLVGRVSGGLLWANMHLLFWLSLIPFATSWLGENNAAPWPVALYGVVLLMTAVAWYIMQRAIIRAQGPDSPLDKVLGADFKGKASPVLYLTGIILAFFLPRAAEMAYAVVALMWVIPDRRVEDKIEKAE
jgi:uncharacterized membrane protein